MTQGTKSIWNDSYLLEKAGPLLGVPLVELMLLWGELVEAFHGSNSYGGDTAEIYAYRLMPNSPAARSGIEAAQKGQERQASGALVSLCEMFSHRYSCEVTINNLEPGEWVRLPGEFGWRAHVRVSEKPKPKHRGLFEVIDEMLGEIPEELSDLRKGLESLKGKLPYTAPELVQQRWREYRAILEYVIGAPVAEWEKRVAKIFSGSRPA